MIGVRSNLGMRRRTESSVLSLMPRPAVVCGAQGEACVSGEGLVGGARAVSCESKPGSAPESSKSRSGGPSWFTWASKCVSISSLSPPYHCDAGYLSASSSAAKLAICCIYQHAAAHPAQSLATLHPQHELTSITKKNGSRGVMSNSVKPKSSVDLQSGADAAASTETTSSSQRCGSSGSKPTSRSGVAPAKEQAAAEVIDAGTSGAGAQEEKNSGAGTRLSTQTQILPLQTLLRVAEPNQETWLDLLSVDGRHVLQSSALLRAIFVTGLEPEPDDKLLQAAIVGI